MTALLRDGLGQGHSCLGFPACNTDITDQPSFIKAQLEPSNEGGHEL